MTESHWIPGIVVLSLGLIAGALYLLFGRKPAAAGPADRVSDAQRRVDSLLAQLREHEAEKHQVDSADWKAEHTRLEQAAADAMRARDQVANVPLRTGAGKGTKGAPAPEPTPAAPTGFFGRHPQLVGAAWGAGVVVFFGALGLWLSQDQKPREAGETATGTVGRGAPGSEADDRDFQTALSRAKDNPGADLTLTGEVIRELISRSDFQQALELNERALASDPFRTELRVIRAFLKVVQGEKQAGMAELTRLADLYPDGTSALIFRGMVHMQAQEPREALKDFEGYLAVTPPQNVPPQLRAGVAQLRQQVSGKP
ncbi:MAG: tetratricopeptide repeat protein [Myxococcaceae bacterium]